MPLLGKGVLAIWNGIREGADAEFLEWHVKEHIPERVSVPGFLRGRRYAAISGQPPYFNFYEVEEPGTLRSAAYLERLNNPTPWTRKVMTTFSDTSRTICQVEASTGVGVGSFVSIACFDAPASDGARAASFIAKLREAREIVGVHYLVREGAAAKTEESTLRGAPDHSWAAILIVEAVSAEAAARLEANQLSAAVLRDASFASPAKRGLYRLEYTLDRQELPL